GTMCDNDTARPTMCRQLAETLPDVDRLVIPQDMTVNIYDMINGIDIKDAMGKAVPCHVDQAEASIWGVVDTNSNGTIDSADFFSPRNIDLNKFMGDVTGFDTKPPPLPDSLDATGGEGQIVITWDIPQAQFEDLFYYQ